MGLDQSEVLTAGSLVAKCNKIGRILPMEVATAKCQLAAGIH